jgi:hypothetical protein
MEVMMKTVKQKLCYLLVIVFLVNIFLPMSAFAAQTNNDFTVSSELSKKSEQTLLSPDTSSWGNQTSTPQTNANSQQNANKEEAIANQILNSVSTSEGKEIETQGIKGWIVKKAIRGVASAIRYGGSVLDYILQFLDRGAKNALSKHANKIADKLDRISTIPDITANMAKEYIYNFMVNDLKMPGRYAMQIADAIKAAINFIIF